MPCMKKVFKNKLATATGQQPGTKSSRRPRGKPLVKRGFCSSIGLHRIPLVRSFEKSFRKVVFDALKGTGDSCFVGEPIRQRPVLPDPAPPCAAPLRPACGMSKFVFYKYKKNNYFEHVFVFNTKCIQLTGNQTGYQSHQLLICRIPNPDIPRAGRGGAAHGGALGRCGGRTGRQRVGSPRKQEDKKTTVPLALRGMEDNCSNVFSEARTDRGSKPAVDNQFITGTTAALRAWLWTSVPTPICFYISFSCKACPETRPGIRAISCPPVRHPETWSLHWCRGRTGGTPH